MNITKDELVDVSAFFARSPGVSEPDRIEIAIYILGVGIARNLKCDWTFLPLKDVDPANGWRSKIGQHKDGGRICALKLVYADVQGKLGQEQRSVTLELQVQRVPNEPRMWSVGFVKYAGVVDMDDREALNVFYKCAAEEVVMQVPLT